MLRVGAALAFGYEAAAIGSCGRLPTISHLCSRHRVLAAATVAGLIVHLLTFPQPVSDVL